MIGLSINKYTLVRNMRFSFNHTLYAGLLWFLLSALDGYSQNAPQSTQLLIVGGGASGVSAGIQAARAGIQTTIVAEGPWLGGMLTSAGVSATDGNHASPSGIWGEFRDSLYAHYGGPEKVSTGWVSHTLFEPSVGNRIFQNIAKSLPALEVVYGQTFQSIERDGTRWQLSFEGQEDERSKYQADFVIDATELGEVMAYLQIPFDVGMEAASVSGEKYGPEQSNNIVQDLTYTAILQEYDKPVKTKKPAGYDPSMFSCACDNTSPEKPTASCQQMLEYARLPNNKFLINWPICGNDYYVNLMEMNASERAEALEAAKNVTRQFIYYLQTELGFKNLGLAKDEFPTADKFPLIPYHREARRLKGVVRLRVMDLERPFDQPEKYYRTGIAVGDYPIDHHHEEHPDAPKIDFIGIKVPSYSVPIGTLIPEQKVPGFLVAEKSISVSNIVNGTTRLQPAVLGIGQAAGAVAAYCLQNDQEPWEVDIRAVQSDLLASSAYLMPYLDVKPSDPDFETIQQIGATGIIKGVGLPYKWANETWFYPERIMSEYEMVQGLKSFYGDSLKTEGSGKPLTQAFLLTLVQEIAPRQTPGQPVDETEKLGGLPPEQPLTRREAAVMVHSLLNPFAIPINFQGIPDNATQP